MKRNNKKHGYKNEWFMYCVCEKCKEAYEVERYNIWYCKEPDEWKHKCKKINSYPINDFGVVFE